MNLHIPYEAIAFCSGGIFAAALLILFAYLLNRRKQ